MKKSFIFSVILGIALIIAIFSILWKSFVTTFSALNINFVIIAGSFYLITILLWGERWKVFLGEKISVKDVFPVIIAGIAVNNITPFARIGGEPVRAYLLKIKTKIKFSKAIAAAVAELVSEFISQITIVLISFPAVVFSFKATWLIASFGFFAFIYVIVGLVLIGIQDEIKMKRFFIWLSHKFRRFSIIRERITAKFFSFQSKLKTNLSNITNLKKSVFLSLSMKFFEVLKNYTIFLALNYKISFLMCFVILAISLIISVIPATPGSMGIMEGGIISFLILSGIPQGVAASFVFIDRLITFWLPTIIGLILIHKYGVTGKVISFISKK